MFFVLTWAGAVSLSFSMRCTIISDVHFRLFLRLKKAFSIQDQNWNLMKKTK